MKNESEDKTDNASRDYRPHTKGKVNGKEAKQSETYLGDGVYVREDAGYAVLLTRDGEQIRNVIWMDRYVLHAFLNFIERRKLAPSGDSENEP
jgi:hypothetical protein